ncbi:TIGR02285 family protein [Roseateles amylovorans]|uniref:TIGR02285 family protein n=1 Tax=Roseateles amylovorans TaxID=2978473 RepID=A0ABY6AZE0_9BURK|nr:TIGR02285 family protein [Roseateles amylovorans]UXH78327.1 TIGR02285 family protein [Roseateles amylovorans]
MGRGRLTRSLRRAIGSARALALNTRSGAAITAALLVALVPTQVRATVAQPPSMPATIRWLVQDLPPHFSFRDGRAPQRPDELGQGEVDGFLRVLIARMPQFRHELVELSLPRFQAQVRQGETLCTVLHVRTPERLQWLYFTPLHPPMMSRQIHVIVRRDDLARFEAGGQPLKLADLMQRRELVGLLPRNRSYGPRIDQLLASRPDTAPRAVVAGRGANLLAMLKAGRMDYTLDYPASVDEFMTQHPGPPELAKLPLAEGRSTMVAVSACSRTPDGRRAIEAIDRTVREMAADPQREQWIRSWRGGATLDADDHQRLRRYLDERGRGPAQID